MLFSYPIILCVIPTCCSLALFPSIVPCLVTLVAVATNIIGYTMTIGVLILLRVLNSTISLR